MRIKVSAAEKTFIAEAIASALEEMRKNPGAIDHFIAYAVTNGADRLLFPGKLAKVLRKAETPTAYMTALLLLWKKPVA